MNLPPDEAERLAALWRYGILDSDFEECFDRLTRLAAQLFSTPIALISLVDRDRQWFKSTAGLSERETPRSIAFCAHAILGDDVMIVPNAIKDDRFKDNPLVVDGLKIRFYAGAPLKSPDGFNLGTFCIIDQKSRSVLSNDEQNILKDFANTVVDLMELRRVRKCATTAALKLEANVLKIINLIKGRL